MAEALVAGHICLDIIPELHGQAVFEPGRLIEAGPATLSTGGAVSNTGQALHRLGIDVRLMGKVSDDLFGRAVTEILGDLARGLINASGEPSSYTVVVNLAGMDRMFLHAPGCNATFSSADVPDEVLKDCRLLHFGYPPLMARMFADDGEELVQLFQRAKRLGVTTSLDMSLPDVNAPSGQADWKLILERVLPFCDLFMPSIEELMFMLDRQTFDQISGALMAHVPARLFEALAAEAIDLGAHVIALKAGSRGLYLRTADRITDGGRAFAGVEGLWQGVEIWTSCFKVDVSGTTGAGDATIAGLLHGLLQGLPPREAARQAVATGAFCCEEPDATSGLPAHQALVDRMSNGWDRLPSYLGPQWGQIEPGEYVRLR